MEKQRKPKAPSKALAVRLGNTIIKEQTATETFVAVIKEIGPSEVANIPEIKLEGLPLVVTHKDYRMQLNKIDENWFVCTHMSTANKKSMLERIANKLGLDIEVNLV